MVLKKRGLFLLALLPISIVFGGNESTATQTPENVSQFYLKNTEKEALPVEDRAADYAATLCLQKGFHCVPVLPGATWVGMWPDAHVRAIIMRLNRTNVALRYRKWLLVPDSIKAALDYLSLSPLPQHQKAKGRPVIEVDLDKFAFGAYDARGDLVYWGPVSGGRPYCDDTHEVCRSALGKFRVYRMQGAGCVSSTYPVATHGGAPMPYCMHYYKGYALHGSTLSGFVHHSRGCVRLFYADARWLNEHFVKIGTEVDVKQSENAS